MMSDKKPSFESGLDLAPIHAMMECNEMRSEVDPSDNRLEWLVELWEGFSIFSSEKVWTSHDSPLPNGHVWTKLVFQRSSCEEKKRL